MSVKILALNIKTVGQLREALEDVPDSALLNIGTETDGYSVGRIGYDGMSVAVMTDETTTFTELDDRELNRYKALGTVEELEQALYDATL